MAEQRIAVFIDAENLPSSTAVDIFKEAIRYGEPGIRRIYGNFTGQNLANWLKAAPLHALTPCQTIGGAAGKNGADIALTIDAMEILCSGAADVFCLATSDGDFTQLAVRIRQAGKTVIGLGLPNASKRFRSACCAFKQLECNSREPLVLPTKPSVPAVAKSKAGQRRLELELLQKVFADAKSSNGWVHLSEVLKGIKANQAEFTTKAYGHKQLWKLLAASGVELGDKNCMARLKPVPVLKVVGGS